MSFAAVQTAGAAVEAKVQRTDNGPLAHLQIALTTPSEHPLIGAYTYVIMYGWIIIGERRFPYAACSYPFSPSTTCDHGFPRITGSFHSGDSIPVELDLPRAVVDAKGVVLFACIGGDVGGDKGCVATPNLLAPSATVHYPAQGGRARRR
ncbi:MAG: hypothetical protein JWP49_559 [Phenylobacterium sp.]|nr:hypothetical protein [Phenylobacterium sp.]